MLLGYARPLTLASIVAVVAGAALAISGSTTLAPVALVLSSVVAIGLLGSARRADIASRSDFTPDRSPRTRRIVAAIVVLAVVGAVWSAWTMTAEWARLDDTAEIDTLRRVVLTALLALIGLLLPLSAVWLIDWARARFRPPRVAVAADLPAAVWPDGSVRHADTHSPLLISNDHFGPAELVRSRRFHWHGLVFGVHNALSPLRPPVGMVSSPEGPVVASGGAIVEGRSVLGRVPMNLRNCWVFLLSPERTREAASDATRPDYHAAYGRLIVIRASTDDDWLDLSGLTRPVIRLARRARTQATDDAGTAQEMLEFVDLNVSAPRDLPRSHQVADVRPQRLSPRSFDAFEFTGFDDVVIHDDDDEIDDAASANLGLVPVEHLDGDVDDAGDADDDTGVDDR
jgi:hypothetical protein